MNACHKTAVWALVAVLVMVVPAMGGSDVQALRVNFAKTIDKDLLLSK